MSSERTANVCPMQARRTRRRYWWGNRPGFWTPEQLAELKAATEKFLTTGEQTRGWKFEKIKKDIFSRRSRLMKGLQ